MNNHCDVDNGPPPAFVQTCGLCGKPLDECRVGPCPWGVPERAVWIEFAEGYADWVTCPGDCLACELEELCTQSRARMERDIQAQVDAAIDDTVWNADGSRRYY